MTRKEILTKGTRIPCSDEKILYDVFGCSSDWASTDLLADDRFISYGFVRYKHRECVRIEKENYPGLDHFVVPLSELERIGMIKEEFVLSEYWYIECTESNKDILIPYWENKILNVWKNKNTRLKHSTVLLSKHPVDASCFYNSTLYSFKNEGWTSKYTEITLEQFKKYVLKEKMNTQTQKIIGYKCPYKILHWERGDIFIPWKGDGNRYHVHEKTSVLPGELVETWEPVYEEKRTLEISLSNTNYKIRVDELKNITIDGNSYDKAWWVAAAVIASHNKAGVYVGCSAANENGSNRWLLKEDVIQQVLNFINSEK